MSQRLQGKVALVTGSSRSIGAAIAKRLAQDGASVVINYASNEAAAKQVADEINATRSGAAVTIKADVSNVESCKNLVNQTIEAFGKIDILVLNAGVMLLNTLRNVDEKEFDDSFLINVKGPFFLVQAAEPHLKEGGRIIFFSTSIAKNSAVLPSYLVYSATKGAIEQFSRILAKELGARGITVNTVSPGPVDTSLFRDGKPEQLITAIANTHPLKRIGTVDEIAPVVTFLASPEAAWVNGQNILINGGSVV